MGAPKGRINTQVRRRVKVRETTPLESEWDEKNGRRSTELRTPADRMISRPSTPCPSPPPSPDASSGIDPKGGAPQPS